MSHLSQSVLPDFDFWDAVSCVKCHLPFATDSSATPLVPFWLTECGHVICNSHLNADQSCARCGTQSVEVIPLQRQMELPMSDWFRSLPHAIDSVAQTAKFQQETMASLLAFYRDKCQKQRGLIERLRTDAMEAKSLRITVGELQGENEQLRQYVEYGVQTQPGNVLNANGKRRITDPYRNVGSRTNSSPRSITTPLGPNRLTLPPDHQEPHLISPRPEDGTAFRAKDSQRSERPGSSRFNQQYAYAPPQSSRFQQQAVLSHKQMVPLRRLDRTNLSKNASYSSGINVETSTPHGNANIQSVPTPINRQDQKQRVMAPPPTPQGLRPHPPAAPLPSSSKRFGLSFPAPTSAPSVQNSNRTFVPSTPSNAPQRFPVNLSSRPIQRISNVSGGNSGGGQRVPFVVSGAQDGFK